MGILGHEVEAFRETLQGWSETGRRLWAARPGLVRGAAMVFAAGAAIAGCAALVAQLGLPGRLPGARDWDALRVLVERDARPGDAVVLSPAWAERAREVLPATVPVFAARRYEGEDLLGVRRAWLVSLPRAPGFSWEPEGELLQRATPDGRTDRLDAMRVSRLDLSFPALPLAFLPDAPLRTEGSASPAVREVREVGGAPRPCLVARARAGAALTLTFAPVRIGRLVRGHVGAIGPAALPGPVHVEVTVGGEGAGAADVEGAGFAPFQVDTTRFALQLQPVSLALTSGADAELCVDAATLP